MRRLGLWHPSLSARAAELPRIEPIESPSPPGQREIRIVAGGLWRSASFRVPDPG